MKLARFDMGVGPRAGVVRDDGVVDLAAAGFPDIVSVIRGGDEALAAVARASRQRTAVPLDRVRLLAPIERPGKYLAVGLNYASHVAEGVRFGAKAPASQLWFNKQTTCITRPCDGIVRPDVSDQVDYEVELGVVIGRSARHVPREEALGHVFGYFVANDVSVRDWQSRSPTWTLGKSFDTHGPTGPWIVTADEIPDPQVLGLRCWVNGDLRQSANTSQMLATVAEMIAYLSTAFTLEPGDLIATGTPDGVGMAMEPPRFLEVGDVVRCEVEGIGALENTVVAEPGNLRTGAAS